MNDKESKAPVYIVIIVAALLVAAAGYYFLRQPPPVPPAGTPAPAATTPGGTPAVTLSPSAGTPNVTVSLPPETIKCELCHTNPQNITQHVNGGKLCINCHGSQVHSIHIGAGTVNLQCETCHGNPPTIPTVKKGEGPGSYSVCENCHAPPPDSLKPSYGNLITIHLSRGKYCTNCHGTDIGAIHAAAIANAANATK